MSPGLPLQTPAAFPTPGGNAAGCAHNIMVYGNNGVGDLGGASTPKSTPHKWHNKIDYSVIDGAGSLSC